MPKLKAGTVLPDADEDLIITRGIMADSDTYELDEAEFACLRPALRRGRPVTVSPKEQINIRLSAEVLGYFRQQGSGWQTRINEALSEWIARRKS